MLVVFGHLLERGFKTSPELYIYNVIYAFHMPLFVLLAGVTSKSRLTKNYLIDLIRSIVVPFVIFEVIYSAWGYWWQGSVGYILPVPYWILWFLVSLFCWRLLLPLFASPIGLAIACFAAVTTGYIDEIDYKYSLSRTAYFFPFFIAGHLYGRTILLAVEKHRKIMWIGFAVASTTVIIWTNFGLQSKFLYGSLPYSAASPLTHFPAAGRMLLLLIGFFGLIGFSALIPSKSMFMIWIGQRSLTIYLLHGLVVIAWGSLLARMLPPPYLSIAGTLMLSVLLSVLLGKCHHVLNYLMFQPTPKHQQPD